MKIAMSFPGCHRRGGIERVVLESCNFLSKRGHDVHLLTSDWDKECLDPRVIVHPVPIPEQGSLLKLLAFAQRSPKILSDIKPGVDVHGAFGIQSPHGGIMWVPSVHKAWIEASAKQRDWKGRLKQKANLNHPAILAMEREYFVGKRYRRLIALTPQVKSDLMRLYGVPEGDIALLSNGYSPSEFNSLRAESMRYEMRKKLGYDDCQKVVIFVANELERKGFFPLVQAIAQMKDPCVQLLAVGRLDEASYAPEIAQLGMKDQVKFTGPSNDVATYYAASDIFALPTQYEAWGLVIVEALACGVPVLTSRLAGAAVTVIEGETGYLLDNPNDSAEIASKLAQLLNLQTRSRTEIEESVLHYSWDNVLIEYERHLMECAT